MEGRVALAASLVARRAEEVLADWVVTVAPVALVAGLVVVVKGSTSSAHINCKYCFRRKNNGPSVYSPRSTHCKASMHFAN